MEFTLSVCRESASQRGIKLRYQISRFTPISLFAIGLAFLTMAYLAVLGVQSASNSASNTRYESKIGRMVMFAPPYDTSVLGVTFERDPSLADPGDPAVLSLRVLPATGFPVDVALALGLTMIVAGVVIVRVGRRRVGAEGRA